MAIRYCLLVICCLAALSGPAGLLSLRDAEQGDAVVWVFFSDRGFASVAEHRAALAAAQARIGAAALIRRARVGAERADDADLPVCEAYRRAIDRFGRIRHESRWLNAVSAVISSRRLPEVESLPFVRAVRPVGRGGSAGIGPRRAPDGRILEEIDPAASPPLPDRADDFYGASFVQLDEIGVIDAHRAGYTGAGIRLMMIDTGYRTGHDAFARTDLVAEWDFLNNDSRTDNEPGDEATAHNHGTITWSAAGATARGRLIGAAYGASFLLAKTEHVGGEFPFEEDHYIAALEWGDAMGVDVASASLVFFLYDDGTGYSYADMDGDTAPVTQAVDLAAARGILVCNGAGNSGPGPGTIGVPADADTMLACGAVDAGNRITNFSSRGPTADGRLKPEVVARGLNVLCAEAASDGSYGTASGTSLSTPLIAGACALVWEAHPEWSAFELREAMMQTADRVGSPDNTYGYGRIDAWAAIHSAPVIVPVPFGLVAPADGDTVSDTYPTFVWSATHDPGGGEISYELWIDDDPAFRTPIVYSDLGDTTFTFPAALISGTTYRWRVLAQEPDGYRRVSRDDHRIHYFPPDPVDPPAQIGEWRIEVLENPWREGSRLRWHAPEWSLGEEVCLSVVDVRGRRFMRECRTVTSAGWNEWDWDPARVDRNGLDSGVHFLVLEGSGRRAGTRIVLAR